jgi:release factor glutamine methyltransferase
MNRAASKVERRGDASSRAAFDRYVRELTGRFLALSDKPEESVRATVAALWLLAAGEAMSVAAAGEARIPALDSAGEQRMQNLLTRRIAGEPLAYITGLQRFMGIELLVSPAAMIPRRETELVANAAVDCLRAMGKADPLVLDVCTGSGNLACSIAARFPGARVYAADISSEAVALAQRNIQRCGLAGRVEARVGDFLTPFDDPAFLGKVDLLICNPPYISAHKRQAMAAEIASHEPVYAFDGGPLGISLLTRLLREAPRFLRCGGMLAFELGLGQGPAVSQRIARLEALRLVADFKDDGGNIRAIVARRQ